MKKNKLLVIGSTGMLGYAVLTYFKKQGFDVLSVSRNEFNIGSDDHEKIIPFIKKVDYVVNCAGVIKPRIDVNCIEDVLRINGTFPWNLARLCKLNQVKCFHVTTDCVYSGLKGNYSENDLCDVHDIYGLSKSAGDTTLAMTLRTSIIGEEKGQSRSLLSWAQSQSGKTVNGFDNHLWNGVTTLYLAEIIKKIIDLDLYQDGIFHIFSPNYVSKYDLLSQINEVYSLDMTINKQQAPESIDRRLTTVFDIQKKVVSKTIIEQLRDMKQFFC